MSVVNLNGEWVLQNLGDDVAGEIPAVVPGNVRTDLENAGLVPDPRRDIGIGKSRWISQTDWLYTKKFVIDPNDPVLSGNAELVFEGLDTFAAVTVNGNTLGDADNMFRTWIFDVTGLIAAGENVLTVKLASPENTVRELEKQSGRRIFSDPRTYARKAAYSFGTDVSPALPTIGIFKSVYVRATGTRFTSASVLYELSENLDRATLDFDVEISTPEGATVALEIEYRDRDEPKLLRYEYTLAPGTTRKTERVSMDNPDLWWPNGSGAQHLYDFTFRIFDGDELLEQVARRVGFRKIELCEDVCDNGRTFYFKINNNPIFMRGANWLPCDFFPSRPKSAHYAKLIRLARNAHHNLLRVWGGGVYEDDDFYDRCDETGIMVWQDFMFAHGPVPDDCAFADNVREEVVEQVRRLRNHPSVIVYCGNSGCYSVFERSEATDKADALSGRQIWEQLIPEVLDEYVPGAIYRVSTPFTAHGRDPDLATEGDVHLWDVWLRFTDPAFFQISDARFVTEFGLESLPNGDTLEQFIPAEAHDIESDSIRAHEHSGDGIVRIIRYVAARFRLPRDFGDWIYKSQITQAEGVRIGVESFRIRKFRAGGALYWHFNDCWPSVSWSAVDYNLGPKALYYMARRFYAPVMLAFVTKDWYPSEIDRDHIKLAVVNDTFATVKGRLNVTLLDFDGLTKYSRDIKIEIPPNAFKNAATVELSDIAADPAHDMLTAHVSVDGKVIARAHHFLSRPKDIRLPEPEIAFDVIEVAASGGREFTAILSTSRVARYVFLEEKIGGPGLEFSDNFFDLVPKHVHTVTIGADRPTDPDTVKKFIWLRYMK